MLSSIPGLLGAPRIDITVMARSEAATTSASVKTSGKKKVLPDMNHVPFEYVNEVSLGGLQKSSNGSCSASGCKVKATSELGFGLTNNATPTFI